MQTTIDNTQRVFLILREGIAEKKYFCNLKQIPDCIKDLEPHDTYKIYHFWNGKFKTVSKNYINSMFESNQIEYRIGQSKYKATFNGRTAGAIGKFYNYSKTITANSPKDVENELRKQFDHITNLVIKLK